MKIAGNLLKIFLVLLIGYFLFYFICVYKDVLFAIPVKNVLKGKIVYSAKGRNIKVIELPSAKTKIIYSVPEETRKQLGFANNPSFSPKGNMVVFSQSSNLFDDKLYIMDSTGENNKLFLDLDNAPAICPSWSPDGKKIAFLIDKPARQGLYVIDLSNHNSIIRLSDMPPYGSQPAWSPDSKLVAFVSGTRVSKYIGNGYYEGRIIGGTYIIDIESRLIKKYMDSGSEISWSPDGRYLAYAEMDGYYIANLDNSFDYNKSPLIPYKKPFFGIGGAFPIRWSPDGKYLVFCKEIWPNIAGIYVAPIDNPKRQIRIGTDHRVIIGMSWAE